QPECSLVLDRAHEGAPCLTPQSDLLPAQQAERERAMTDSMVTLRADFVSESAAYRNTFGWYNSLTGMGGILFADVNSEGNHAALTPGASSTTFSVKASDLPYIQYFLISDGYDLNRGDPDDLTGPVKVIQLSDGSWAVADVDSHGNVITSRGKPDILEGA